MLYVDSFGRSFLPAFKSWFMLQEYRNEDHNTHYYSGSVALLYRAGTSRTENFELRESKLYLQ